MKFNPTKVFRYIPFIKGLLLAEEKYIESSKRYTKAGDKLIQIYIDQNVFDAIKARQDALLKKLSLKNPKAKAIKKDIDEYNMLKMEVDDIKLKLKKLPKIQKELSAAESELKIYTKRYESAYKKFYFYYYLLLIPSAIPIHYRFTSIGEYIDINFYVVLAQIFPILFFAVFIERKITESEKNLISKGFIPSRDRYKRLDGFLSFTLAEVVCLVAIAIGESSTFTFYLVVVLLFGYFSEIYSHSTYSY